MDFELWIGSVRAALGPVPRTFSADDMRYLTPPEPHWLQADPANLFWGQYYHHELLFTYGEVSWSAVQQANGTLFQQDETTSNPGLVLVGPGNHYDAAPPALTELAARLAAGTDHGGDDPFLAAYGAMLAGEGGWRGKTVVPPELVGGHEVYSVDLVIHREHLPLPFLASTVLPVIHHPSTAHVWVVPARYWPDDLVAAWPELERS
jgi:hypothetical protein